ncbi:hypothetical protein POSPLADRAFT_1057413 [Postia placenta MAD-698-R-SB12]|uniref:Uncharacterized protein n=1 Tax=Postia placenta MAD-698-R-SB12 TaxID=670580 RepID=A0A1X6MZ59_9APHY|nr:hypothetical protein POSPLADRAFT_1057413 [Postia placenta MAD-698-R-SB12]OSX61645.1 hypothetical protein POSPLADRAFT_1057413 [Postia placenta MAD-698-R-SB12]
MPVWPVSGLLDQHQLLHRTKTLKGGGAVLNSYNPHNILHNAGRIDMEMNSPVKQLQILRPQIFVLLDRHGIVQDMVLNAAMKIKDNIELDGLMSLP